MLKFSAMTICCLTLVAVLVGCGGKESPGDKVQKALKSSVERSSTALGEGLEDTFEHFKDKWDKELLMSAKQLRASFVKGSVSKSESAGKKAIQLELVISNQSNSEINFANVVSGKMFLLQNEKEISYAPMLVTVDDIVKIPSKTKVQHTLEFIVPEDFVPVKIKYPAGEEPVSIPDASDEQKVPERGDDPIKTT